MGLLAPLTLLWLIPLSAAVIVLYLLKLKRKEKTVSSVFLWRQAVQDVQANAPFQKLRKNRLLFIQLGVLILGIAALARPFSRAVGFSGQNIVVIIDSSASMKATDTGKSRFDEAKRVALGTIDKMARGDSMLVISASAKTRIISSFTTDKKNLSAGIASLTAQDTRANLREAMVLALSLVAKKKNPQIVILSDGGFEPISDIQPRSATINFIRIGKRSDNVAIIAMDARKPLSGVQQVFIGLRNFSKEKHSFNLEVYLNDQLFDIREESLAPGESKQEILDRLPQAGGRVTAKLDLTDDLASDNAANVYLTAPKKISVLLVTPGNLFLERAFNLNPDTEVVKASQPPADLKNFDIAVFDRIHPPDDLPPGSYLLIDTACKSAPMTISGPITRPSVADWDKKHPVNSFVDFTDMSIGSANALTVKSWGQELIDCEGGTIAVAGEESGRRFVVLGWDLLKSDFPMRVGFPIFITNVTEWLSKTNSDTAFIAARTGEVIPIEATGVQDFKVECPNGQSLSINSSDGKAFFDGTEQAGVYKVKIGKNQKEFACNILSADESDITPRGSIEFGDRKVKGYAGGIKSNREYWRVIVLFCIALTAFEWYAFHRRLG